MLGTLETRVFLVSLPFNLFIPSYLLYYLRVSYIFLYIIDDLVGNSLYLVV